MNPATIIFDAQADGVILALAGHEAVKVRGDRGAVSRWLPAIRDHKREIIQALTLAASHPADPERAGIIEFDGRVPREWAEGYARLLNQPAPADVAPDRWQTFVDDCGRFLDSWAVQAAALGWDVRDLFGLADTKPEARVDLAGLLWLLRGRELVALTDRTAAIMTPSGAVQHFYRRDPGPGQTLAWEARHS